MTTTSNVIARTKRRADETLERMHQEIFVQTDRMFAVLMAVQWLAGIAAAYWISPRAWSGTSSETSIHVWAAIVLGGAISGLPIALIALRPGTALTRHIVAIGQMLTSALLIHLSGGRIETHFHVFGSLAFLAFYRDWRVLITATVVVSIDHALRGLFWPQSVYGVLTSPQWRFLEHAGWVVFEDIVLVLWCVRGTTMVRHVAERTAQLETSEDRYRAVVEQMAEGVVVFDIATRSVLEHNPTWRAMLAASPDAADMPRIERSLFSGESDLDEIVRVVSESGQSLVAEGALHRLDGSRVDVACSFSPTLYAGNHAICVVVRDITERRRLDQDLKHARDAAIESARLKSEFLANMSHEIRTPMNGIVGMTNLLLETSLTSEQRDFAGTVQSSADALLTILNDILDFSKVEAGKLHFETLDFDLRQAVEGTLDMLAPQAFSRGLELTAQIDQTLVTQLRGDPGRLRQVLANLIGNALKFTEIGEVQVRASAVHQTANDTLVRFEVQDTGIGIPLGAQSKLFEAFTQADGSTTRKYGGTGLGLAISKRLVALMGGEIGMRSAEGHGSTFWFTARFEKQPNVQRPTTPDVSLVGRRVLIVDDNATNRRILHHQLAAWGIDDHAVPGGMEAIAALRAAALAEKPFEVVILDRQMPGFDGLMVAQAIKRDPAIRDAKLVMMTSLGDLNDGADLERAGILLCVTKPVKQALVRECLERALTHDNAPAAPSQVRVPSAPSAPNRARVLVAEDNIVNQKVALLQLRRLGFAADAVANGLEAIEALGRIAYDVVLMDCQMPEMDGYETARLIRRQEGDTRHIPIIAVTANALPGDREKCLQAGMDDYVSKPIQPAELEATLTRCLAVDRPSDVSLAS